MARVKRAVGSKQHRKKALERPRATTATRAVRSAPRTSRSCAPGSTRSATAGPARASSAGCGSSASTPPAASTTALQPVHRRAERGRHRGRPQDPRRSRRHRHRGVRQAGRGRRRRPSERPVRDARRSRNPVQRLRRLLGRRSARSEEGAFVVEGPSSSPRPSPPDGSSRRSSSPPAVPVDGAGPVQACWRPGVRARRLDGDAATGCSRSCACRRPTPTLGGGRLRRRRRPHHRSRQLGHDPALG